MSTVGHWLWPYMPIFIYSERWLIWLKGEDQTFLKVSMLAVSVRDSHIVQRTWRAEPPSLVSLSSLLHKNTHPYPPDAKPLGKSTFCALCIELKIKTNKSTKPNLSRKKKVSSSVHPGINHSHHLHPTPWCQNKSNQANLNTTEIQFISHQHPSSRSHPSARHSSHTPIYFQSRNPELSRHSPAVECH